MYLYLYLYCECIVQQFSEIRTSDLRTLIGTYNRWLMSIIVYKIALTLHSRVHILNHVPHPTIFFPLPSPPSTYAQQLRSTAVFLFLFTFYYILFNHVNVLFLYFFLFLVSLRVLSYVWTCKCSVAFFFLPVSGWTSKSTVSVQ